MGNRPNFNHWLTPDDDPLKEVLLKRYNIAAQYVTGIVCDLACGWGFGSSILARSPEVYKVFGVDMDAEAIQYASNKMVPKITFLTGDLDNPTNILMDCSWVVTCETVEHLKDPETFIERIQSVASKGIILTTPIVPTVGNNPHHQHDFTPEQIDGWFEGWDKVRDERLSERVGQRYKELYKLAVYIKPEKRRDDRRNPHD